MTFSPSPGSGNRKSGPEAPDRVVFHVDMDAFFASVEQLFNPRLRGRPVLICGNPQGRSVVATASYEARPFGIHCGMPVGQARRLCPHGTFIEGDPGKYIHLSLNVLEILRTFTPKVEPFSIDEAFLEVTGLVTDRRGMLDLAARIQRGIAGELSLTASIGIGPNKFVAKMASGVHKPQGLTCFSRADFRRYFWPLPVEELWGVGEATAQALRVLGILRVQDLALAPAPVLSSTFGVVGPGLRMVARGRDDSPVVPCGEGPDAKSIGHEYTLARDEADLDTLRGHLLRLSDQVARRARLQGFAGRVVSVRVRKSDFTTRQAQHRLGRWVSDGLEIYRAASALFARLHSSGTVRLLGVSLAELERRAQESQRLLFPQEERGRQLVAALDGLKGRLGEGVLFRAGAMLGGKGGEEVARKT